MAGLFGSTQKINITETRVGALRIQNSSQGLPVPMVYGTTRITGNLLWYGDFTSIPHTETTQQGGKGGGGTETSNTTYTYTVGVVIGLCEGPTLGAAPVGKAWSGKDITDAGKLNLTEFDGSYSQSPWSYLATNHPSEALGYRGTAYVACAALELGSSDSIPNLSFEVTGMLSPLCLFDVNVSDVIADVLTNPNCGAGWNDAQLDSLTDLRLYCDVMNLAVSPAYVAQQAAAEMIDQLAKVANAAPVWSNGILKVIPYADEPVTAEVCESGELTYTPDLTVRYTLTYSDFIADKGQPPVKITRRRPADRYNSVQISCLDRSNDYNKVVVEVKDQASIDRYGLRPMPMITADLICDPSVARTVAQLLLQRALYIANTYEFTVGWRYARLEPMDVVALVEPLLGLNGTIVRITEIEEDENGKLSITAEDLTIGISTPGGGGVQPGSGHIINTNVDPGDTHPPMIFQPPIELSGVPQIWIGAAGGENWGGAEVWASDDGSSYSKMGLVTNPARYGVLTANFPAGSNPDLTHNLALDLSTSNGTLTSATPTQASAGATLSYVGTETGGEIIGYTTVTLTGAHNYTLSDSILRGQSCSLSMPHFTGESFMRLDAAVGKFPIDETRVGNTIQVKLLSFNKTGGGIQTLADVSPIPYTVQPLGIVVVNGAVPNVITAAQVFCIPSTAQYSVLGRMTLAGRINCDGRLIVT